MYNKRIYGGFDVQDTLADSLIFGSGARVKRDIAQYEIKEFKINESYKNMNKAQRILSEFFMDEVTKEHPFSGVDVTKILTDPDNEGLFELPKDKKFWEMPITHYADLVKRKGRVAIEGALLNLRIFNANKNPDVSEKAEAIRLKLKKQFDW